MPLLLIKWRVARMLLFHHREKPKNSLSSMSVPGPELTLAQNVATSAFRRYVDEGKALGAVLTEGELGHCSPANRAAKAGHSARSPDQEGPDQQARSESEQPQSAG